VSEKTFHSELPFKSTLVAKEVKVLDYGPRGWPRLTLSNNMDYAIYVKYSTFHRMFFQVFTIASRLYHLEYWLARRHRHLWSLLKAEPFKILKMSATTGQKVVALQVGN